MSQRIVYEPLVFDPIEGPPKEIRTARTIAWQRTKARTAALDALVRARAFLDRADAFTTTKEGSALLRDMRRAGFELE